MIITGNKTEQKYRIAIKLLAVCICFCFEENILEASFFDCTERIKLIQAKSLQLSLLAYRVTEKKNMMKKVHSWSFSSP